MKNTTIKENRQFVGREKELKLIQKFKEESEAQILICYGRRRVGKTELIEQAFRQHHLLKFEGLQGQSKEVEIKHFLQQLGKYLNDDTTAYLNFATWRECFELLARHTASGIHTIYFEELQWMACYEAELISDLKYVWDNFFRRNPKLRLVLCGSATSFMLTNVVQSQALYNRSQTILELKELSLAETQSFFSKNVSLSELMDIYLCFGGIPEYLKRLKGGPSLFINACQESFTESGFFFTEIDRIYVSQLSNRKNYKEVIEYLSHRKFANRENIIQNLGIKSGGSISDVMNDLLICRFIDDQFPLFLRTQVEGNSKLTRYQIADAYLRFYYKFIRPQKKAIEKGQFDKSPVKGIQQATLRKWLGFAFEYWCLKHSTQIAEHLGFSDVEYKAGPYYNRSTEKSEPGYQLDLVFDRADRVITACEIKYTDHPVGNEAALQLDHKLSFLSMKSQRSLQKVLITLVPPKPEVYGRFDRIVCLQDLV